MLKKNVYICYPPGYSGSYINWAINASDKDQSLTTVPDPVNTSLSKKFGGAGTSHLHTRLPTHQGLKAHLTWVLYNQPKDCRVYIINVDGGASVAAIHTISCYDPDGIFINIHNDNDVDVDSFCTINCVTKWPVYSEVLLGDRVTETDKIHDQFNPYDCSKDRIFRNWVVEGKDYFRHNAKLDFEMLDAFTNQYNSWYDTRHRAQPHEVNESMYIVKPDLSNRVFELSARDVSSDKFLPWFENFMSVSQVSDGWDTSTVQNIHPRYISSQVNLQWFESIARWEQTGELDDYLVSHSIIESQVIIRLFKNSNILFFTDKQKDDWDVFYYRCKGPDWPAETTDEHHYWDLPEWIQKEILDFGYKLSVLGKPNPVMKTLDWKNLSLEEINQIYQQTRTQ